VKILNEEELSSSTLRKIEDIWQTDVMWLSALVEELQAYIPDPNLNIRDYFGEELDDEISKRYDAIFAEAERKRNEEVEVDGATYKVINYFDVYHLGWELDTRAWVVEKGGTPALVHSNHGRNYFVEDGAAFLKAKVKELNGNVKSMKSAISLLELNG
jgi:hypothetical protein